MSIEFRRAQAQEMDEIYLMGFDVWSNGLPLVEYLAGCRKSKKYQSGRWFVLHDRDILRSSLLVHDFEPWGSRVVRGVGSVATQPNARRQGYGRVLVHEAVRELVEEEQASVLFLYSDIGSQFYEREGFQTMSPEYQSAQGSTLMIRMVPTYDAGAVAAFQHQIPRYF